jgi:hypothetical protein
LSQSGSNARDVFANNELNMREIDVFGFDYDYTLAVYRWELAGLIYDRALQRLISKFKV